MSDELNELNPYRDAPSHQPTSAIMEAEEARASQEVQAALVVAMRFPRNQPRAMERILDACARQALAENALYAYARGGTEITGPSIRLAEVIAQNWQHVHFGVRELGQRSGRSTVEAFAWDLETNVREVRVFEVPHERHTRSGVTKLTDPRDIYENNANMAARRLRACILAIIPGDVVEAAVNQCQKTLVAQADVTPEGIKALVEAFEKIGVSHQMLFRWAQRKLDTLQPSQVVRLRSIYASIRDGMSTLDQWFVTPEAPAAAPETPASASDRVKESLRGDAGAPTGDVQPPTQGVGTAQGEKTAPKDVEAATPGEIAHILDILNNADTLDGLTTWFGAAEALKDRCEEPADKARITRLMNQRYKELGGEGERGADDGD